MGSCSTIFNAVVVPQLKKGHSRLYIMTSRQNGQTDAVFENVEMRFILTV